MKELDVLLERFAARALDDRLDDAELDALERLLGQPDQDVHAWLVSAPGSPPPPEMRGIVALVRSHALTTRMPSTASQQQEGNPEVVLR